MPPYPTDFFPDGRDFQRVRSCVLGGGVKYKRIICRIKILQKSKLGDRQGKIRKPRLLDTLKRNYEEIALSSLLIVFHCIISLLIAFHFIALFTAFSKYLLENHF